MILSFLALSASAEGTECQFPLGERLSKKLDRRTDSVERADNEVRLLVNGAASWASRKELAETAEVILVKTFIWADDEIGRETAQLLARRARAGATVIVQYDFKGSTPITDWAAAWSAGPNAWVRQASPFRTMAEAGVTVLPTGFPGGPPRKTPSRLTNYDHEKFWITGERSPDGAVTYTAITGGLNIASEYMYGGTSQVDAGSGRGGWRDTDVLLRGPVLEDIVSRYLQLLEGVVPTSVSALDHGAFLSPQPAAGAARVRFVWAHPAAGKRFTIERLYRSMIRATPDGEPITIETAYFAPTPPTWVALKRAGKKGQLTVVSNSDGSIDVPLVSDASKAAFAGILQAAPQADLYLWNASPGLETLHSKFATFGRCGPVIIGSANLDGLSAHHNSEAVVLVVDEGFRGEVAAALLSDLTERNVTHQGELLRNAGFFTRIWRHTVYVLGWYWM